MAWIKNKELSNGITGNYWVLETHNDKMNGTTGVTAMLFVSKETREAGCPPIHTEMMPFLEGTYLTGAEVYEQAKASRMELVTPAVLDDEDNVVTDAVYEEKNWFADAVDDN